MDGAAAVARLRACEWAAWATPQQRQLYSTPLIDGYPYYTVPLTSPSHWRSSEDSCRRRRRGGGDDDGADEADGVVRACVLCEACQRTLRRAWARRHVVPYDYTFAVFAKGRWVGQRLLSVYSTELPHHTHAYYAASLRVGRLRCVTRAAQRDAALGDGRARRRRDVKRAHARDAAQRPEATARLPSPPLQQQQQQQQQQLPPSGQCDDDAVERGNVVLGSGDLVLHTVHRHEVPVRVGDTGVDAVRVLAVRIRACGVLSVYKPAGLVTHATGRFHYNSLLGMLEYVLAPRRLHAWLYEHDALLQGLVDTRALSGEEVDELYAYYNNNDEDDEEDEKKTSSHGRGSKNNNNDNSNNRNDNDKSSSSSSSSRDDRVVCATRAPRPCYRLDRVTSGLLLLGVSRRATRCVSVAVMRKTLRVGSTIGGADTATAMTSWSGRPPPPCEDDTTRATNSNSDSNSCGGDDGGDDDGGVRKRYLARTHGSLVSCHGASDTGSTDAAHAQSTTTTTTTTVPSPVVHACASRTGVCVRWRDARTLLVVTHAPRAAPSAMAAAAAVSATLLRHVACVHNDDEDDRGGWWWSPSSSSTQSIVLCTPLTGRMHQIRIHLGGVGCAIVGDGTYARALHDGVVAAHKRMRRHDDNNNDDEGDDDASHNGDETMGACASCVYHSEDDLPASYTAYMRTHAARGAAVSADDDDDDVEPLCYECAHKLHVAVLCEARTPSQICLHAHAYRIDAALLLPAQSPQQSLSPSLPSPPPPSSRSHSGNDDGGDDDATVPRVRQLLCTLQPSTTYVRVDAARHCVTFVSPPPSWVSTRALQSLD